jgi:malonyl-CoA/methylmalonyl-CoA synthetase
MTNHLFDRLCNPQKADPGKIFLTSLDEGELSYGALLDRTGKIANLLVANGLGSGDRVAVQIPKSIDAIAIYLAVVRTGAIYIPLNIDYTAKEISYFLGDSTPRIFICEAEKIDQLAPLAQAAGANCLGLDPFSRDCLWHHAVEACSGEFTTVECGPDDIAAILYTSGTSGRPKGAMLSHDNLLSNARALEQAWAVTSGDCLLHALPLYHTHGLFVATNLMLLVGASMLLLPKFVEKAAIELMPHATIMMGVPTFYTRLLADDSFNQIHGENIRLFISGSAPLLVETFRAFHSRTGKVILERYGMTETGMNTSNPLVGARRAGTVGRPLPDVQLRVSDSSSAKPLPPGQTGMIEVKGPNVFKGYWNQPDKTEGAFRPDGYFVTGDLGFIDENGYLTLVGRSSDLIISGGLNIYPGEVEAEINLIEGVIESAVIGVPHADLGEAVIAIIASHALDHPAVILDHLEGRIAAFKKPKHIDFQKSLPRNAMGKVQKALLRTRYKGLFG